MQLNNLFLTLGLSALCVSSYKIHDGKASINYDDTTSKEFTCCKPAKSALELSTINDVLDIEFTILDDEAKPLVDHQPTQVVVSLSNGDLQQSFIVKEVQPIAKISIDLDKISPALLYSLKTTSSGYLLGSIIVSGSDSAIKPTDAKDSFKVKFTSQKVLDSLLKDYSVPKRFNSKPEIHHIFREAPKQVAVPVALFFMSCVGVIFLWFLFNIYFHNCLNFSKLFSSSNFLNNIAFLLTIVMFEYNFLQYYMGDSIFSLLSKSALLAGPALWFGSRVLRSLAQEKKLSNKSD